MPLATQLTTFVLLMVLALHLPVSRAGAADAQPLFQEGTATLVLDQALAGGKPLTVNLDLRGGKVRFAFGTAKTYNVMSHAVDASGLTLAGDAVSGEVKVTMCSDSYFPKDRQTVPCVYQVEAKTVGNEISGTYKGKYGDAEVSGSVGGQAAARPELTAARFAFTMENAVAAKQAGRNRRLLVRFAVKDGKVLGARLESGGGATHALFTPKLEGLDLKFEDHRLTGVLKVAILGEKDGSGVYTYMLDGGVIGSLVAGAFTSVRDDQAAEGGRFQGTVDTAPAPKPEDSVYAVTLNDSLGAGKGLNLYFRTSGGKLAYGFGLSPGYNYGVHDIDFAGLKLEGTTLKGELKVTVNPDPWVPADHQPAPGVFQIEAAVVEGTVDGRFKGTFGTKEVSGAAAGELKPPPAVTAVASTYFNMQNSLLGGNPWQNRCFVNLTLQDDKVTGGKISNNHTDLDGSITGGTLKVEGDSFRAELQATIKPSGGVWPGDYTLVLDGKFLGEMLQGTFETRAASPKGEATVKKGKFTGSYKASSATARPAEKKPGAP